MVAIDNEAAALESFLSERLADLLRIDPASINVEEQFSAFGLDSLDAVTIVYDLEELLGRELPPTLLWDYPTVRQCCSYLVENPATDETAKVDTPCGRRR